MNKTPTKTKDRILYKACLLFADQGYAAVSTRKIAKEADVRHGSLRYHFTSKEALYIEVFRKVYDLENALTYDILLRKEPMILDTPEGKAYAVQRIVFDYLQRHVFIAEPWRKQFIYRELTHLSPLFYRSVNEVLREESDKMFEFFYLLSPKGTPAEAFYWAHLPDTQGLYYFRARHLIENGGAPEFHDEIRKTITSNTAKTMISLLNLPVPPMLE